MELKSIRGADRPSSKSQFALVDVVDFQRSLGRICTLFELRRVGWDVLGLAGDVSIGVTGLASSAYSTGVKVTERSAASRSLTQKALVTRLRLTSVCLVVLCVLGKRLGSTNF